MVGFLLIVSTVFITSENLGYTSPHSTDIGGFLSIKMMWIVNVSLGVFSGILFFPTRIIAAILAGGATTAAITGLTMLYASLRGGFYMLELLIPFFISLYIGFLVFRLFIGRPKN